MELTHFTLLIIIVGTAFNFKCVVLVYLSKLEAVKWAEQNKLTEGFNKLSWISFSLANANHCA